MNLRHRKFEQALRRRIRTALKASLALRKEYRRLHPPFWSCYLPGNWLAVLVFIGVGAGAVGRLLEDSQRLDVALTAVAFWFVGVAATSTRWIYGELYDPATVTVLYHLPVSDDAIFRARWRSVWRRALGWSLTYLGVGAILAAHAYGRASGWPVWLILPSLQYLLAVVMALHLAVWAPVRSRIFLAGYACAVLVLFAWERTPDWIEPMVVSSAWLPPFGWLNHCAERVLLRGDWVALALLIPIGGIVAAARFSWQRLRVAYQLGEPEFAHGVPDRDAVAGHGKLGPTEVAEQVRAGVEFQPMAPLAGAGWIERAVYRWWTPRERLVAAFFAGRDLRWSRSWRRMAWIFLASLATVLLFAQYNGTIVVLAIVIPLLTGAPLLGGTWRGFSKRPAGGQFSPMYALYPIGFWEAFRVILKTNCVRSALALPFALALAAAAAWRLTGSVEAGWVAGLKAAALWFGIQPLVTTFRFAEATNDTQRVRLAHVFILVPLIPILLGSGAAMFFVETITGVALAWGVAAGASGLLTWAYARGWAKGRFDLLSPRGEDTFDPSE